MFEPSVDPADWPGTPEYDERYQARRMTREQYEDLLYEQEQADHDSRLARRPGR